MPAEKVATSSLKVVYAALAGNVLVALSKFAGASLSGSSAMLTEAIHSTADTVNQILLLFGNSRSKRRKDTTHSFGYGMEVYFWTFVVAVIVLLAGGAASMLEGARQLASPEPIKSPSVSLGILALSALFEGASFAIGYRSYKRRVAGRSVAGHAVGMWQFIKLSKDPNLYESLLEDSAALIGLVFAATGVLASVYLNLLWADGVASIAIGLLLIACSYVIADATRSLIAGEAVAPPILEDIRKVLLTYSDRISVLEVKTLHLGPQSILVAISIESAAQVPDDVRSEFEDMTVKLKSVDPRIAFVYFRFASFEGDGPESVAG